MNQRVKIQFDLNSQDQQGYETEQVWAEPIQPDEFRILNSPFFAFGVSADDVVSGAKINEDVYKFQRVVEKGGHSTYRIFLQEGTIYEPAFKTRWARIELLGATFENANDRLVAVDIPATADVHRIYELLQEGERDRLWAFEEGNYEAASGRVA